MNIFNRYAGFGAIGGYIQLYWTTRNIIFLGGSIITIGCILTYYNPDNIYVILLCSFGVSYGIGCGLAWGPSIVSVIRWFPDNKAFMTAVLLSSVSLGSICYSLMETIYINPNNISNDPLCGYSLYPSMIQYKVPNTFLLIAIFSILCTIIGGVFLFDKKDTNTKSIDNVHNNDIEPPLELLHTISDDIENEIMHIIEIKDELGINQGQSQSDYTLRKAVKSQQFWIMFMNVLCNVYMLSFTYSDWKLLAQNYLFIENDTFLLILNITAAIFNLIGRMIWGRHYDKYKSYKLTMMTVTFILFICITTLPLIKLINNKYIIYTAAFIWISCLWFCNAAVYTILPASISDIFGDKYTAVLTGFMMFSEILSTGLQSGLFTVIQSINIQQSERWMLICFINAGFVIFSFSISSKFTKLKQDKKISDSN